MLGPQCPGCGVFAVVGDVHVSRPPAALLATESGLAEYPDVVMQVVCGAMLGTIE